MRKLRSELEPYLGKQCECIGLITDLGMKCTRVKSKVNNSLTLLLTRIKINNQIEIDHAWVNFENIVNFKIGDKIQFTATVVQYRKRASKLDWKTNEDGSITKRMNDYGFEVINDVHLIENEEKILNLLDQ